MDAISATSSAGPRRPNARGQGERLREEIISAAVQMLDDLADDEALSLRAVARAVSISPTSVYLYFPDQQHAGPGRAARPRGLDERLRPDAEDLGRGPGHHRVHRVGHIPGGGERHGSGPAFRP